MNYYDNPALSQSMLKELKKSPAHFYAKYIDKSINDAPEEVFVFGNLLHTLLLEPDKLHDRFVFIDEIDKRTKAGKEYWEAVMIDNRIIIGQSSFKNASKMIDNIKDKPIIQILFKQSPIIEKEFYFKDAKFEIDCKMKLDIFIEPNSIYKNGLIIDYKTTKDASLDAFMKSIYNFGYHNQVAFYCNGIKQLYNLTDYPDFIFIAQEKSAPYECAFYNADTSILDIGLEENEKLITLYKTCLETNSWHGYSHEIQSIGLPYWAYNNI